MRSELAADKRISRVLWISRINGWSVAGFAGLCAIVVLFFGDFFGFTVGFLVAFSGWLELRGNRLLLKKNPSSFNWLVGSQIYLIIILWSYASYSISKFDQADPWAQFPPGFKDLMLSINPDVYLVEVMVKYSYYATYIALIVAVLIYQGGLCLYYFSRKKYLYPDL